jgi:hypothetical protein
VLGIRALNVLVLGDVCDNDQDNDGWQSIADNCPLVPNRDQIDSDGNYCLIIR